jgi:hypothetical protein
VCSGRGSTSALRRRRRGASPLQILREADQHRPQFPDSGAGRGLSTRVLTWKLLIRKDLCPQDPITVLSTLLVPNAWRADPMDDHPVPPLPYHYTDAPGLCGIVKSRTLWATHIEYLNDA